MGVRRSFVHRGTVEVTRDQRGAGRVKTCWTERQTWIPYDQRGNPMGGFFYTLSPCCVNAPIFLNQSAVQEGRKDTMQFQLAGSAPDLS